ncbi:hypothetical protein FRC09_002292 [Ceratobasidium sp. 395]|nr:hypothetical protein FRC09_002292 [Ceratobasidium sp. 395]
MSQNKEKTNPVSHPLDAPGGPGRAGPYQTRGVKLKFSHTKAPHVPPPDPPSERVPVPESAAARRRRIAKEKQAATETGTNSQGPANEAGQQPEPEQTPHPSGPSSAALESPAIRSETPAQTTGPLAAPDCTNVPTTASLEQGRESTSLIPTSSNLPFSTPRRANHSQFSFGPPAFVFIGNQPNYNDIDAQFPAPFIPNHSIPFLQQLNTISPQRPGFTQAPLSNYGYNNTEFADPHPGPGTTEAGLVVGSAQSNIAQDIFHPHPTSIISPVANYNMLYSTVMGTIPAFLPSAPVPPPPSNASHSSGLMSRESSVFHDDPVPAQATPALRTGSVPPNTSFRHNSHQSSLAPQTSRSSSSHAPTQMPPAAPRPNSLRQGDFTHDQVTAIKHMRHRYQFYLVTEDPFPINVYAAREICISYAEEILGASRAVYNINHTTYDFVRAKEANIRHGFSNGLLKVVEEGYGVNASTGSKLETLICDSNFVYASFDLHQQRQVLSVKCLTRL